MNRRTVEILDFGTPAPPADRDVTEAFSRDLKWNIAEHPTTIAMVAAAHEQAARPSHEQSAVYAQQIARVRALLADVPKATKAALVQARARFTEIEHVLSEAEAELSRINNDRPLELGKIDRWAAEAATAERRIQALTASHTQAAGVLNDARMALLAALQAAAKRRYEAAARTTEEARAQLRALQATVSSACADEHATQQLFARIRDEGLRDSYIAVVLKGDL